MYDDDNFGGIFPTRTGTPTGSANERKMLDSIGGSDGFRTQQKTNSDGSVTMLRTRNGMPEFFRSGGEQVGEKYIELDYSLRFLEDDNAMTYNFDMLNTPLVGDKTLYIEQRPRDTPAGDVNYRASNTKLLTTDGMLETDYQLTLQKAIIQPDAGAARTAKFTSATPVTAWFADDDIIRGPTGVHALVRKAKIVSMLVNGRPASLYLQPPPYETPAGEGLCVLDQIKKLGDPWHGLARGNALTLPNGGIRTAARPGLENGKVYPLVPYGIVPTESADAADVAAGRTWLNYALLAGHCLYEQSIDTVAQQSWIYIAPDNSTWRVAWSNVFASGVQNIQLKFYPLRRVFLMADKMGGLVQTILAPINPSNTAYAGPTLYDADSKGANAVFFRDATFPPARQAGASLINIQGIPPAATATNTLLCHAYGAGVYKMYYTETELEHYESVWYCYNPDIVFIDWNDPHTIPLHPNPNNPFGPYPYYSKRRGINRVRRIIGFAFDIGDNLKTFRLDYALRSHYELQETNPTAYENLQGPVIETALGGGYIRWALSVDNIDVSFVEWPYDGNSTLANVPPNSYGYFADYGFQEGNINWERYTNKVYGLQLSNGTARYWLPPGSPDGPSAYAADIVSATIPYATYHPIKQELVWETNPVQFI